MHVLCMPSSAVHLLAANQELVVQQASPKLLLIGLISQGSACRLTSLQLRTLSEAGQADGHWSLRRSR